MPQQKINLFSHKTLVTLVLLLISSLHAMIFTFFQLPDNYATIIPFEYKVYAKLISYAAAITISIFHSNLCRKLGVKFVFIMGLSLNFVGLVLISLSWFPFPTNIMMYLCILFGCLSFGLALLTVINSLITYLVIEYPDWINAGIILLFIFLNLGIMLSPLLVDFFNHYNVKWVFILILMLLSLASIFAVAKLFSSPKYPKRTEHLKKSSSLWKDLHYRLAFFVLAIAFYGIVENTISLWGELYLAKFLGDKEANTIMSLFWLFMIIGQLLVLVPLYYMSPRIVFTGLCGITLAALWGLYEAIDPFTLALFIILGGIGCSAIFPLLVACLGKQIIQDSKNLQASFLPYLELGCAYILAGYIFGIGLIDFLHVWDYKEHLLQLPAHFYYAIWSILGVLVIYLFLEMYATVRKYQGK